MSYTNSSLVDYTKLSPNHSGLRSHAIDRITPHCVVGQCTVETLGEIFAPMSRQASSNYGIGKDGKVGMYVEEKNRSWCSSSSSNDHRAITIEVASDTEYPYTMNDVAYNKLIDLCVDICRRNGKTKLLWFGNKDKTLSYNPMPNEMVITIHRWFASTACPGDWLYFRLEDLAAQVTARLNKKEAKEEAEEEAKYYVQTGVYSSLKDAKNMVTKLKTIGFDAIIKDKDNKIVFDKAEFEVGDTVIMEKNAPVYGMTRKFQDWVYNSTLYVRGINGSQVIISTLKEGDITGVVDKKYLTKI